MIYLRVILPIAITTIHASREIITQQIHANNALNCPNSKLIIQIDVLTIKTIKSVVLFFIILFYGYVKQMNPELNLKNKYVTHRETYKIRTTLFNLFEVIKWKKYHIP